MKHNENNTQDNELSKNTFKILEKLQKRKTMST